MVTPTFEPSSQQQREQTVELLLVQEFNQAIRQGRDLTDELPAELLRIVHLLRHNQADQEQARQWGCTLTIKKGQLKSEFEDLATLKGRLQRATHVVQTGVLIMPPHGPVFPAN